MTDKGEVVARDGGRCGDRYGLTVNAAKAHTVIQALGWVATNMPDAPVRVLSDLNHVVNTVNGKWQAHQPETKMLCRTAKEFLRRTEATLEWIRQE